MVNKIKMHSMVAETLNKHISREHGGSQVKFGKANGVARQQVHTWLKMGCIVADGVLYSPRREVK